LGWAIGLGLLLTLGGTPARAADKLLDETVDFTGTILFISAKVPGMVIGAIRDGESVRSNPGRSKRSTGWSARLTRMKS
jgi:D-alanyl-D-alanine-carboxypeptidase/D-alanyl-D-alanine-endopeptidase